MIKEAKSSEDLEIVKELFIEYVNSLGFDLEFQNFSNELKSLPGKYAPPEGTILLAFYNNKVAGCVALRKIEQKICEMKRLYVRPAFRGKQIGEKLAKRLIEYARQAGYQKMRLDTIKTMTAANQLYEKLHFHKIKPYYYNPIPGATFYELEL